MAREREMSVGKRDWNGRLSLHELKAYDCEMCER